MKEKNIKKIKESNEDSSKFKVAYGGITNDFKNMINGASVSIAGTIACITYMVTKYNIKNVRTLTEFITASLKGRSYTGIPGRLIKGVADAVNWANRILSPIIARIPDYVGALFSKEKFNSPISYTQKRIWYAPWAKKTIPSTYTYGNCICLAFIGAAIIAVLYKALKRTKEGVSEAKFSIKNLASNKTFVEDTNNIFGELTRLNEASNSLKFPEMFISKMYKKTVELWEWASKSVEKDPMIATLIAVSAACIFAWSGMKNYVVRKHKSYEMFDSNVPTMESFVKAYRTNKLSKSTV